jgi:thioredoxin-related protein
MNKTVSFLCLKIKTRYMKKAAVIFSSVTAMALFSFCMSSSVSTSLPIGSALPKTEVKLKDVSGKEITLSEIKKENGILVMFSCNTCPYVIKNQSRTNEICSYAQTNHIGVVLLNSNEGSRDGGNSLEDMQSYAKAQGYAWPYALDKNSELADAFGANRTPECFLFDRNDKLVYHGAIDDSPGDIDNIKRHHLKEAMDEMLAGKEVSVKQSRSVGCSIKRAG